MTAENLTENQKQILRLKDSIFGIDTNMIAFRKREIVLLQRDIARMRAEIKEFETIKRAIRTEIRRIRGD